MTPKLSVALALVSTLVLSQSSSSALGQKCNSCNVGTFRVTGKNDLFALACRCGENSEFVGRAIRELGAKVADTNAQEALTVSCIEDRKAELSRLCAIGRTEFERRANHVLRVCMAKRPKNPDAKGRQPFSYKRNACKAEFRQLPSESETLLVCACTQRPGYIVHPGAVQFITGGSPNGNQREANLLQKCTGEVVPELSTTCRLQPSRFNLRAAQLFNVCCKRSRTQFPKEKLKCQAVVPDNVASIALTYD